MDIPLVSRWILGAPLVPLLVAGGGTVSVWLAGHPVAASSSAATPRPPCPGTPHPSAACSRLSRLRVRFPGLTGCHYDLSPSRNQGRPTAVTCLIEGDGFVPSRPLRLSYDFSISELPLTPNDQPLRVATQPVRTPLPHVQCLMRRSSTCRSVVPDAHGHFGPVWVRLIYMRGDRDQTFELRASGGPKDRAVLALPYTRMIQ